jgi:Terminase large subunit, T4likevirus-type, N-terminal
VNILDAIRDREILGAHPAYRNGLATFGRWLTVAAAIWGLPLAPAQAEFFESIAGQKYDPPAGGWSTVAIVAPRQIGKSTAAATWVAFEAVRPGPRGTWAILCAQDRTGASRALLSTTRDFFTQGLLAAEVTNTTAETIELASFCTIAIWPTRPASLRGVRARIVVLDEADFLGTDNGQDTTRQMIQAARPCLATTGGKLVLISSPNRSGSTFHKIVTDSFGSNDPHTLALHLPVSMNPTLSESYFAGMKGDPIAYAQEVEARWVEGESGLYDHSALRSCVVSGRVDLPPEACKGQRVRAGVDTASGGKNGDAFAVALGFRNEDRIVTAALRRWPAPFDPKAVVREVATLLKSYGCREVTGDRFGAGFVVTLFRDEGIKYEPAATSTSDAAMEAASVFQAGGIELPDPEASTTAAEVMADLQSIVRRPGGGRDRADLPRTTRGHCDLASALVAMMGALPKRKDRKSLLARISRSPGQIVRPSRMAGLYPDSDLGETFSVFN